MMLSYIIQARKVFALEVTRAAYELTANIYAENGDYQFALNYINQAIVTAPSSPILYVDKSRIYEKMSLSPQPYEYSKIPEWRRTQRELLENASDMAKKNGNSKVRCIALGALAYSWSCQDPIDIDLAERYAEQADMWGGDSR